jgi:hypothetical protein
VCNDGTHLLVSRTRCCALTLLHRLESVFRSLREAARRLRDGGRTVSFSFRVVALHAGADSGWVNGQIIRANGGVI